MSEETFELNENLELQIIKNILSNRSFLVTVIEHVRPEFFENQTARICITIIKDYFIKYSDVPTGDIIKSESKNYLTPKDDENLFLKELESVFNLEIKNEEYLKIKVLEHCQFQSLKRAILQSANLLSERSDDYRGKINDSIKKALSITEYSDLGLNYFKNPEERIIGELRHKKIIKTGIRTLDSVLGGGWSVEDTTLVVVIAPTGIGKSIFLCKFGSFALLHGHKVVHITHELSENKTASRYDSLLTNIAQKDRLYRKDELLKKIIAVRSMCGGENLRIKEFPTKTCAPNAIRAYLEKIRDMEGFVPDVIINDYLDLMVANYNVFSDNEYNQQKRISEELRAIAQEYNVPMITASQTNRGASDKDIISGTDIAESYGKVFTSDLLVTINQNMKERLEGRCNLYIAKNRNGPSGVMIPLNIIYEMMNVTEIMTEQSLVTESEKERIIDGKY